MSLKDFEKRKKAIWDKHEKLFGQPIVEKLRQEVEKMYRVDKCDEETLEDLDGYLCDNIPLWRQLASLKGGLRADKDSTEVKPKKVYRKCFERRFYLVDFVVAKGLNTKTKRINWKRTVMEWNEAHPSPSDTMSLPVLKAEYYRALRESPLKLQFILTRMIKQADIYRLRFYEDNYIIASKILKEEYDEFFKQVMSKKFSEEVRPPDKFLTKSFYRLLDILDSIHEIRVRRRLKQENELKLWMSVPIGTREKAKGGKP